MFSRRNDLSRAHFWHVPALCLTLGGPCFWICCGLGKSSIKQRLHLALPNGDVFKNYFYSNAYAGLQFLDRLSAHKTIFLAASVPLLKYLLPNSLSPTGMITQRMFPSTLLLCASVCVLSTYSACSKFFFTTLKSLVVTQHHSDGSENVRSSPMSLNPRRIVLILLQQNLFSRLSSV